MVRPGRLGFLGWLVMPTQGLVIVAHQVKVSDSLIFQYMFPLVSEVSREPGNHARRWKLGTSPSCLKSFGTVR